MLTERHVNTRLRIDTLKTFEDLERSKKANEVSKYIVTIY